MLTADLVLARRRGGELRLQRLGDDDRARAREIAAELLEAAGEHVGRSREELDEAIDAVHVAPQEARWRAGLAKLMTDRCTWDEAVSDRAPVVRSAVFLRAAAVRRALEPGGRFDREGVVAEVAREMAMEPRDVEEALYADLRGAQPLRAIEPMTPSSLVEAWERGQAQAVLLRATRITLDVTCATAGASRALFRRLKFLRLLYTIERGAGGEKAGHRIVIDGPFSLFESSTKYGLQLALVLPVLDGCDAWSLEADVRWGKDRTPLTFRLAGRGAGGEATEASKGAKSPKLCLPDEIADLLAAIERRGGEWRASPSGALLDLPGVGLCVPDLVFERRDGEKIYLEVMGFWSRDAVWRRVELVQAGLAAPILFAVSARLRVSEEVLAEDASSALYVYKGTMSARAVLERVEGLARRVRSPLQP